MPAKAVGLRCATREKDSCLRFEWEPPRLPPDTRFASGVTWKRTTMPDKQQLHHLIDELPESETAAAARYLEFLLAREAPVDADLLARIDRARDQPSPGISHRDILREFGL